MRATWGHNVCLANQQLSCFAAGACLLALGCAVDDRTLTLGNGTGATSNTGATAATAGQSASSTSGSGGAPANVELPICVYDGEIAPECRTMVANAGFQTDIKPWQAEAGLFGNWVQDNATESDASGSIRVLNFLHGEADGVAPGAAVQCLEARAGQVYDMAADVFIKEGQGIVGKGEPYVGKAGLGLFFFKQSECVGESIGNVDSPLTDSVGAWIHTEATGVAPEQSRSLQVRLSTLMPFRENGFEALFDNIFVRQR